MCFARNDRGRDDTFYFLNWTKLVWGVGRLLKWNQMFASLRERRRTAVVFWGPRGCWSTFLMVVKGWRCHPFNTVCWWSTWFSSFVFFWKYQWHCCGRADTWLPPQKNCGGPTFLDTKSLVYYFRKLLWILGIHPVAFLNYEYHKPKETTNRESKL